LRPAAGIEKQERIEQAYEVNFQNGCRPASDLHLGLEEKLAAKVQQQREYLEGQLAGLRSMPITKPAGQLRDASPQ
jgi:hypothetical protein